MLLQAHPEIPVGSRAGLDFPSGMEPATAVRQQLLQHTAGTHCVRTKVRTPRKKVRLCPHGSTAPKILHLSRVYATHMAGLVRGKGQLIREKMKRTAPGHLGGVGWDRVVLHVPWS